MTKIAVLDDWQGTAEHLADWSQVTGRAEVVFFREHLGDRIGPALAGFQAVMAMRERTRFSAEVIAGLPDLKLLTFTGARNAAVDVGACTAHGILVCYTAGMRPSAATAELALGLMLAAARHIANADARMREGSFQSSVAPGIEMQGRTLGLLGLGRLGGAMARYGRALGMELIAWSQNLTDARATEAGARRVEKAELFARSDVVSIHLVLSDRTRGIVDAEAIGRMKHGAILVNTSRGPLIERSALAAALRARKIFAALDVYDVEPLPRDDALLTLPNTVLTPHLGYVTEETMRDFYAQSVENIAAWLDGKPVRVMNPELLAR